MTGFPQRPLNRTPQTNIDAQRALVRSLLPHLSWRHHGIGALQAYIQEGVEPEIRVHVWHPSLVREGIAGQGDAHDHRFDLESTVLCGTLFETVYTPADSLAPKGMLCDLWAVENARSAGPERKFDGACVLAEREQVFSSSDRVHRVGATYHLPRHVFHRTWVHSVAVTVCTMREKKGQARILVPTGKEPVHAFGDPATSLVTRSVLQTAAAALAVRL